MRFPKKSMIVYGKEGGLLTDMAQGGVFCGISNFLGSGVGSRTSHMESQRPSLGRWWRA